MPAEDWTECGWLLRRATWSRGSGSPSAKRELARPGTGPNVTVETRFVCPLSEGAHERYAAMASGSGAMVVLRTDASSVFGVLTTWTTSPFSPPLSSAAKSAAGISLP